MKSLKSLFIVSALCLLGFVGIANPVHADPGGGETTPPATEDCEEMLDTALNNAYLWYLSARDACFTGCANDYASEPDPVLRERLISLCRLDCYLAVDDIYYGKIYAAILAYNECLDNVQQ